VRGQGGEGGEGVKVKEGNGRARVGWKGSPAVRTVFLKDSIIRLSPDACRRTLVRSNGLVATRKDESVKARYAGRNVNDLLRYRCRNRRSNTYRIKTVSAIRVTLNIAMVGDEGERGRM
jgi:hypothetical protein